MSHPQSLAESWEAYAADNVPADASELAVVMIKRAWYAGALTGLTLPGGPITREALLAEVVMYGRTVGREVVRQN